MKWYFLLLLGIVCISTSAILVTMAGVDPTVSAFYRNLFASCFWLALLGVKSLFLILAPRTKKCSSPGVKVKNKDLTPVPYYLLFLLGFFFAVDLWAWHRAIIWLGAGPATLIGNLQVIFVALFSLIIFQQKLPRFYWPGSLLALGGIGLLTLSHGLGDQVLAGLILGLFTALTYSCFLLLLKFVEPYHLSPSQILAWVAVTTTIFLLLPLLWEGESFRLGQRALVILVIHGFVSSVVGWWLIIAAMIRLPITVASTLLLLQPVLTHIWGHLFLNQRLVAIQMVGIGVALVGIRLANWQTGGQKKSNI